jgi:hypothetical protein
MGYSGDARDAADPHASAAIDRRHFLRSAAAATGLVWAAPAVTSFAVPAYAQTSPPPGDVEVLPGGDLRDDDRDSPTGVAGAALRRAADGLPVTGPEIAGMAAVGAGTTLAGRAAVRASKRKRSSSEPESNAEEPADD